MSEIGETSWWETICHRQEIVISDLREELAYAHRSSDEWQSNEQDQAREVVRLTGIIEEAVRYCNEHGMVEDGANSGPELYVDISPLLAILTKAKSAVLHIPDRSWIVASKPPKYYCNNENDERNPCYSHSCNWGGWDG